jgi:archaeal chaperonin
MTDTDIKNSRTMGRDAQRNNILAAKIISDIVKTTLGPKGMDKMLVDSAGNVIITNDGATILREMEIEHPAAKMLVDIAKTQEQEVGDGTTTVALLAGKLLENAEKLLDRKIHPTIISKGYKLAASKAIEILEETALPLTDSTLLKKIAMTAMTGKGAESEKEKLAGIVVNAVEQIADGKEIDINNIKIQKVKGEGIEKSELVKGIIIEAEKSHSEMPSIIDNAKIALIDFSIEIKGPENETKISISTPEQFESFIISEERQLKDTVNKIIASGANVVLCMRGIDDTAQYFLAKAGILAIRRVSKSDLGKIARATSGKIVSQINELNEKQLGFANKVREIRQGNSVYTFIEGCNNPKAVTILVRGGSDHVLDEIERAIEDSLGDSVSAIRSGKIVAGGGAIEIEIARKIRGYAKTIGGREQLAIEEFANSLEGIPETLAENAGLDPIDVIAVLKKRHEEGFANDGLNLFNNNIEDTFKAGILEPLRIKTQAIQSASEVANLILRIDDVLVSKNKDTKLEMPKLD